MSFITDTVQIVCTVVIYITAVAAQLYMGLWLTNSSHISVDKKPSWYTISLLPGYPVVNNVTLLLMFALQHSLMARNMIGSIIKAYVPEGFDKIIYSTVAIIVFILIFLLWEPLPTIIWHVTTPWLRYSIIAVRTMALVWLVFSIIYMDSHTWFGIKQPLCRLRKEKVNDKPELVTTGIYGMMRHPIMSGFMGVLLITPTMVYPILWYYACTL